MIKFRQKSFIAPAIGLLAKASNTLRAAGNGSRLLGALNMGGQASMITSPITGMIQQNKATKDAERQQREANKQAMIQQKKQIEADAKRNKELTDSLNRLAKTTGNNTQVAAQVGSVIGQQQMDKSFSIPVGTKKFITNLGTFGKDIIKNIGSGSKVVQGDKISLIYKDGRKKGKSFKINTTRIVPDSTGIGKVGKTLIGLGTLGVVSAGTGYLVDKAITADARKVGLMPKKKKDKAESDEVEKNYSSLSQVGIYLKKGIKYAGSKENLKSATGMAVFGLLPAVGYVIKRKQYKDQVKEQEKTYSKFMGKLAKKYAILRHPGQTITGGLAKLTSWGNFGRDEIKAYGNRLIKNSESDLGKKMGKFIIKNPKTSNIIGAGIGAGILAGSYDLGDKLIRKTAKHLDKDAYAYEEYNNQPVEEQ